MLKLNDSKHLISSGNYIYLLEFEIIPSLEKRINNKNEFSKMISRNHKLSKAQKEIRF